MVLLARILALAMTHAYALNWRPNPVGGVDCQ